MTKHEIVNLIKERRALHGGILTKEDLFDIGMAHRQLPKTERSWAWLLSLTGGFGTSEAYRVFIVHRLKTQGNLESFDKENATEEEKLIHLKHELQKERMRISDERTNLNKTLRDEARIERLEETVKECARKYSKLPNVVKGTYNKRLPSSYAFLPIADLHLGEIFENYVNSYNYEEAVERINVVAEETIHFCRMHNVHTLMVANMGDLISGIIHVGLRLGQEYDAIDQTMRAAELLAEFLNEIQQACPTIEYRSVLDNHSRLIADKNQNIALENLNRICDWFVGERLKATSIKFMKDNLDPGVGRVYLPNGKPIFFMHGHEDKKSTVVQDIMGMTHEFPSYIVMAHYHNSAEKTYQGAKVFITGSLVGTNPYAFSKRMFGEPEQKLLIFDDKDNIIDINIRCKK